MKQILLLFVLMVFSFVATAQISSYEKIETRYNGGERGLLAHVYHGINYPSAARKMCRMGIVKSSIVIDSAGRVTDCVFKTQLGLGIEESVYTCLMATTGNWLPGKIDTIPITIGFSLENIKLEGLSSKDILVNGFTKTGPSNGCYTEKELFRRVQRLIQNKDYKNAQSVCEELLMRNPDSSTYQSFYKTTSELNK